MACFIISFRPCGKKVILTAAGITIPFPQCDVHLIHEE